MVGGGVKGGLSAQDKAELVLLHASGLSGSQTALEFHTRHPDKPLPDRGLVGTLHDKFRRTGSVSSRTRIMSALKNRLGVSEVTDNKSNLGRALVAEMVGNFVLNFFGCLSVLDLNKAANAQAAPNIVVIALSFGLAIMACVQSLGHVSGAHINPAVTFGFVATGKVTIIRAVLYIIAQCIGAIGGSAALKALTPPAYAESGLGMTTINEASGLTPLQGFGIEFFLGFILVLVVFGVCDPNKADLKAPSAVIIGLTVALGHLGAIDYTGSSMNPARTFGSAVIANIWANHWVYWAGPSLGGIAASLLYTHVFAAPTKGEYSPVQVEEKELKRLDGKNDDGVA
ncbi:hypothetical protein LSTR_LSTR002442 [Laodelphax striatellus]|uniref:Aquaporin n=1 Tax=Laodelphax striatellus TaxID=195883 RepID=A0A482X2G4_LAOST|nr:hypothetical protein LSTR_LSTR002442 [Laodelphax striatellus]